MLSFAETGLSEDLLNAITEMGFTEPTPIQAITIPHLLKTQRDLKALAQTGTGKTAAFGLPIMQQVDPSFPLPQALILSPTRELAMQICNNLQSFGKYKAKLNIVPVYGGTSIDTQIRELGRGAQIVVGTPGRVLDLINRGRLNVSGVKWLVLDEADEMLSMGFKDDLDAILAGTPPKKQTLLFSATMPREVAAIADKYMYNPEEISVGKKNTGADTVNHQYYVVQAKDMYSALKRVADMNPKIYGIIFCRTRQETKEVADKLMADGYNADALHGDLSQVQRDVVMNRFRSKHLQLLVATDVAARGIDVTELTHIINYHFPDEIAVYTHRSGRTGRAGKSGTSISILHMREEGKIYQVERQIGKKFEKLPVPSGQDVCEKQLFNLVDKIHDTEVDTAQIAQYLPRIYKELDELSREDLIQKFVSVEFNRFLEYYKNAPDLNVKTRERSDRGSRDDRFERSDRRGERSERGGDRFERGDRGDRGGRRRDVSSFSKFIINIGVKNNLNAGKLIGMINDALPVKNAEIGKIDVLPKITYFEVESKFEKDILASFSREHYGKTPILIELMRENNKEERRSNDERSSYRGGGRRDNDSRGERGGDRGESRYGSSESRPRRERSYSEDRGEPKRRSRSKQF